MLTFFTHRCNPVVRGLSVLVMACFVTGFCSQAIARQEYVHVNWDTLDLSSYQRNHLNELDQQWKSTVNELAPRIHQNQKKLKQLMSNPEADAGEIMQLQQEIHQDKSKLKIEATQIFLNKRKVLNQEQRDRLRQMLNLY